MSQAKGANHTFPTWLKKRGMAAWAGGQRPRQISPHSGSFRVELQAQAAMKATPWTPGKAGTWSREKQAEAKPAAMRHSKTAQSQSVRQAKQKQTVKQDSSGSHLKQSLYRHSIYLINNNLN